MRRYTLVQQMRESKDHVEFKKGEKSKEGNVPSTPVSSSTSHSNSYDNM